MPAIPPVLSQSSVSRSRPGRKFSTQTFSLDYGVKKRIPYRRVFDQINSGSGIRFLARHILRYRRENEGNPLILYTDEKQEYRQVLEGGEGIRHLTISSHMARTVRNDLFAMNYCDRYDAVIVAGDLNISGHSRGPAVGTGPTPVRGASDSV